MAAITGLLCQMITGKVSGGGTDGNVYVGVGGREFKLDSSADDYEAGSWREYVLGDIASGPGTGFTPVLEPDLNDPRKGFPLNTVNLNKSPVYIRFEPKVNEDDNWNLSSAHVLVYTGHFQFHTAFGPPEDFDNLWMGPRSGKMLFLTNEWGRDARPLLEAGRKKAGIKDAGKGE